MKKLSEVLLKPEGGAELLMGNSALARAMLESGVQVVTSYPGSPTPEIADALMSIPEESSFPKPYFEFSTNEKVATEVAFGASINGHLSCVFFKSVGLNVAADSFVQLGMMELIGGMVIIIGDDPGANSSQNEQDNRHLARLSYIPVLEPATPTEAYQYFKEAVEMSRSMKMPVLLRMTTHVCHAKESIDLAPLRPPREIDHTPRFRAENGPYLPITSMVFPLKRKALKKLGEVADRWDRPSLQQYFGSSLPADGATGAPSTPGAKGRGIITAGLPTQSVLDVLGDSPFSGRPDILKLGMVYPLPRRSIVRFLEDHPEVKVLEELDDFLEQAIKAVAYEERLPVRIIGKSDPDEWIGEYTPDKVATILKGCWPDLDLPGLAQAPTAGSHERIQRAESGANGETPSVAPRPAQLCPGCGHRSALHAVKRVLASKDAITVADIGCHSLGILPPYRMGEVILCMGHVGGTAAGLSLFNRGAKRRPVLGFIGDSTFYHAGLPGIINALYNQHNFTLVVMENGTTAMTGHQDHPGTGLNAREATERIPIRKVLEGLGVTSIRETDAYQQSRLESMVGEALDEDGLSVIIARHPCMLKQTREMRRRGKTVPPPVKVGEQCDQQMVCIRQFACPSYQYRQEGVVVENDLCIGDGSCRQTCPVGAIESTRSKTTQTQ